TASIETLNLRTTTCRTIIRTLSRTVLFTSTRKPKGKPRQPQCPETPPRPSTTTVIAMPVKRHQSQLQQCLIW
ncbi:MAG: hypothetical protein ACKPKO_52450, partial [Candidatus Fonsibacter sp.]